MPEAAAPVRPWHRRLGIRAQLLAILLPGIAALLAFDSWTDYRDSSAALTRAYDQALVEPVVALDESVFVGAGGDLALMQPFDVLSMFEATEARQKFLHVGIVPLDGRGQPAGPERSLMGPADLPGPAADVPLESVDDRSGGRIGLYDARYRGIAVRIAQSRRVVHDGLGRPHELRVQAAEALGWREQAHAAMLRRELIEDSRTLLVLVLLVWVAGARRSSSSRWRNRRCPARSRRWCRRSITTSPITAACCRSRASSSPTRRTSCARRWPS
jgi:two-component system, OmpR family, sensor histidine kinase TctE